MPSQGCPLVAGISLTYALHMSLFTAPQAARCNFASSRWYEAPTIYGNMLFFTPILTYDYILNSY